VTEREELAAADSATETHHEPHGAASPHGSGDDVPEHEMDDAGGHAEHGPGEELGPVDVPAWTAGALGIALGLIVVACLAAAASTFGG
jgi:hypothetical protein